MCTNRHQENIHTQNIKKKQKTFVIRLKNNKSAQLLSLSLNAPIENIEFNYKFGKEVVNLEHTTVNKIK